MSQTGDMVIYFVTWIGNFLLEIGENILYIGHQNEQKVQPCTLMVFLKEFFKKKLILKKSADNKKGKKITQGQSAKIYFPIHQILEIYSILQLVTPAFLFFLQANFSLRFKKNKLFLNLLQA